MQQLCKMWIADHTGFHFHDCGRPAKWVLLNHMSNGEPRYRCGLHARSWPNKVRIEDYKPKSAQSV